MNHRRLPRQGLPASAEVAQSTCALLGFIASPQREVARPRGGVEGDPRVRQKHV